MIFTDLIRPIMNSLGDILKGLVKDAAVSEDLINVEILILTPNLS